jgi:hypothetical protein
MTAAVAPRTPLPPSKASPLAKRGLDLGVRHYLGPTRPGRRGRLSPCSTRGRSVRTQEQAWPPSASSPDRAPTPRSPLAHPPPLSHVCPPHTTSRGRVPRNSFAPARATLHTPSSRHAPTSLPNVATSQSPHLEEGDGAVNGPALGFCAGGWG